MIMPKDFKNWPPLPTDKEIIERVREDTAKLLYESHHPRMFTTWEELKTKYPNSAEGIRQQADKILSHPNIAIVSGTKVKLGTSYGRSTDYVEEWWIEIDGEHIDPYDFIKRKKPIGILREEVVKDGK